MLLNSLQARNCASQNLQSWAWAPDTATGSGTAIGLVMAMAERRRTMMDSFLVRMQLLKSVLVCG
jgi:hypothetical protein